jgi:hypothetical protein
MDGHHDGRIVDLRDFRDLREQRWKWTPEKLAALAELGDRQARELKALTKRVTRELTEMKERHWRERNAIIPAPPGKQGGA